MSPTMSAMHAGMSLSSSSVQYSFRTEGAAPTAVALVEIPPPTRPTRAMDEHPHPYPAVAPSIASVFWKATDIPWQISKVTTGLFERRHELVQHDQTQGEREPRTKTRQAQDGSALDRKTDTRELNNASSVISRGLQVPRVSSHEVFNCLLTRRTGPTRDELGHVIPYPHTQQSRRRRQAHQTVELHRIRAAFSLLLTPRRCISAARTNFISRIIPHTASYYAARIITTAKRTVASHEGPAQTVGQHVLPPSPGRR